MKVKMQGIMNALQVVDEHISIGLKGNVENFTIRSHFVSDALYVYKLASTMLSEETNQLTAGSRYSDSGRQGLLGNCNSSNCDSRAL